MVKKAIWAIGVLVLIVGVLTASAQYYGSAQYGQYYQYPGYYGRHYVQPYTYNYPLQVSAPTPPYYEAPYYIYPYNRAPMSSRYIYRYAAPTSITSPEMSYPKRFNLNVPIALADNMLKNDGRACQDYYEALNLIVPGISRQSEFTGVDRRNFYPNRRPVECDKMQGI